MKTGNYCIAVNKDKNIFCQILAVSKMVVKLENVNTKEEIRCRSEDIIAVLGDKPNSGKVFGVSTLYARREFDTRLGRVRVMFNVKKDDWKIIKSSISKVVAALDVYLPADKFEIDIYNEGRQCSGTYQGTKLVIKLPTVEKGSCVSAFTQAIASAIWKHMGQSAAIRWYKLFKSYNKLTLVDKKVLENICTHVLRIGTKEYKKECDEQDWDLFRECLSHIARTQKLDAIAISALINSSGNEDMIKEIWPKHADIRTSNHPFGDISARGAKQLYIEGTVHFVLGSSMSPKVAKIIKSTSLVEWPKKKEDE